LKLHVGKAAELIAVKDPSAFSITLEHEDAVADGTAVSGKPPGLAANASTPGGATMSREATLLVKDPLPAVGASPLQVDAVEQSVMVAVCDVVPFTKYVNVPPQEAVVDL
jgi:hypothetical protein